MTSSGGRPKAFDDLRRCMALSPELVAGGGNLADRMFLKAARTESPADTPE